MKKALLGFLLSLVLCGSVFAAAPVKDDYVTPPVSIVGAEDPVPYGEMVQVQAVHKGEVPADLTDVHYDWKVFSGDTQTEKRVYVSPDSKTVIFAAGIKKTKFLVVLNVTYTYIHKDKDGKIDNVQTRTSGIQNTYVTVGDKAPEPIPPGPNPTPVPPTPTPTPPVVPDTPLGLVKASVAAAAGMTSPTKTSAAQALAVVYNQVAADIEANKIATLGEAYKQLKDGNAKALASVNADLGEWQIWDDGLRRAVYKLYLDKKLTKVTDYPAVFREIAQSFSYIK
jgi:hypothetical protein